MTERQGAGYKTTEECWDKMSRSEKMLVFLIILIVLVLLGLFIFIIIILLDFKQPYCYSPNCVKSAANLLESMDFEANPCEDIQQFVCGYYTTRPNNQANVTAMKKFNLISAPIDDEKDGVNLVTVKNFYQACFNTKDMDGNNDIIMNFINKLGGWPLLLGPKWPEQKFHWIKMMTKLRQLGIKNDWIIGFDYYQNNNKTNLLKIGPPSFNFFPNDLTPLYYFVKVGVTFGASEQVAWEEAKKVGVFQNKLFEISDAARKNLNDHNITVEKLNEILTGIDLLEVFDKLTEGLALFTLNTTIRVSDTYIHNLNNLLSETPKKVLANFIIWKVIEWYLPFLSGSIRENYQEIDERAKFCFEETRKRFNGVLEKLFLMQNKILEIWKSLKVMTNLIMEQIREETEVDLVILGVDDENSGINGISFSSNNVILMINEVHKKIENKFYSCLHKNASECSGGRYFNEEQNQKPYFDNSNTIYLPSSLLYNGSYNSDWPNSMNFARMGRIIADTILTGLNIEDMNSADLAFKAYVKLIPEEIVDRKLPGLNYTGRELFWIETASNICPFENETERFEQVTFSNLFKKVFKC